MTSVQTIVDFASDCLRSQDPSLRVLAAGALAELHERSAAMTRSPSWTVEDENGETVHVTLDEIEAGHRAAELERTLIETEYGGWGDGLVGLSDDRAAKQRLADAGNTDPTADEYLAALEAAAVGDASKPAGKPSKRFTTEPLPSVRKGQPLLKKDADLEVHSMALVILREARVQLDEDGLPLDQSAYNEAVRQARARLGR